MKHNSKEKCQEVENEVLVRKQRLQNAPCPETKYQVVPQYEDEIDLRDLVNVIIRRKSIIIVCLLFCLITVGLYTYMVTPQYKAKGLLRAFPPAENIADLSNGTLKAAEIQQNTIKMLQSDKLALRVMKRLDLTDNSFFNGKEKAGASPSNSLSDEAQGQSLVSQSLARFHNMFSARPVRKSQYIEVFFSAPSPALAAEATNMVMEELVNLQIETNQNSSRVTIIFLEKQIGITRFKLEGFQLKLSESEKKLLEFAQEHNIPLINIKQNPIVAQIESLQQELVRARSNRGALEKKSQQSISGDKAVILDSTNRDYKAALEVENALLAKIEQLKIKSVSLDKLIEEYISCEEKVKVKEAIIDNLQLQKENIKISLESPVTNIEILDVARSPLKPIKPQVALNLALGLALGLIGGVGAAFLFDFFDNTIKKPGEIAGRFGIPILGLIPYCKEAAGNPKHMSLKLVNEPKSSLAAAFSKIMISIRFSMVGTSPKTILLTSILPKEGKSSLAGNCGLSYLSEKEKCLLIDVNFRKSNQEPLFHEGELGQGLSSFLSGKAELSDIITPTDYPGLDFISSGPLPSNPAQLLSSKGLEQLLRTVAQKYELVILDGPAYQGAAEILALSAMVDGVILVAVEGKTPRKGVKDFTRSVGNVGGRLLGVIINKKRQKCGGNFS